MTHISKVIIFAGSLLVASMAIASDWIKIDDDVLTNYIDKDSIKVNDSVVTYWDKWEFIFK